MPAAGRSRVAPPARPVALPPSLPDPSPTIQIQHTACDGPTCEHARKARALTTQSPMCVRATCAQSDPNPRRALARAPARARGARDLEYSSSHGVRRADVQWRALGARAHDPVTHVDSRSMCAARPESTTGASARAGPRAGRAGLRVRQFTGRSQLRPARAQQFEVRAIGPSHYGGA